MRIQIRAANERLDGESDVTFLCALGEGKPDGSVANIANLVRLHSHLDYASPIEFETNAPLT